MIPGILLSLVASASAQEVIDVHTSAGVVVPRAGAGTLPVGGLGIGTPISDQDTVRLRILGAPLGALSLTPPAPAVGWGTLIELEHRFGVPSRIDLLWTSSVGFAAAEAASPEQRNVATLALHTGLGLSVALTEPSTAGTLRLAPVMGVAPRLFEEDHLLSVFGPTFELRVGWGR